MGSPAPAVPPASAGRYPYRVTVQLPEGRYATTLRAAHPVDAGLAVLEKLGFGEDDPHHPPLALFIVPVRLTLVNG